MNIILNIILKIPAVLVAFTFHEFAHAKVADKLGDKTARFQGRLNLNPLNHIDPMGAIALLLLGFGWAKPVQTNPSAYKNRYKDDLKVSIAGPLANLAVAFIGLIVYRVFVRYAYVILPNQYYMVIAMMLKYIYVFNVSLFVFNMLPIPGFDGAHVLMDLFPSKMNKIYYKIAQYEIPIVALVILLGGWIVAIPIDFVKKLLETIVNIFL